MKPETSTCAKPGYSIWGPKNKQRGEAITQRAVMPVARAAGSPRIESQRQTWQEEGSPKWKSCLRGTLCAIPGVAATQELSSVKGTLHVLLCIPHAITLAYTHLTTHNFAIQP